MRFFLGLALLVSLGCPAQEKTTDGGSAGSSTTAEMTTSTGGTEGQGTTTAATTAPTTGGTSTGGGMACEDPSEAEEFADELCDPFCERLIACELDGVFDGCPCYGLLVGPTCLAKWDVAAQCFAEASCEVLNSGRGACWDALSAAFEQCEYGECGCQEFIVVGSGDGPDDCGFSLDCIDQPEKVVRCKGDTCTCTIGEMTAGTCPAGGVCVDGVPDEAMTEAKFAECCG